MHKEGNAFNVASHRAMFKHLSLKAVSDKILSTQPQLICNTRESITSFNFLPNFSSFLGKYLITYFSLLCLIFLESRQ